MATSTGPDDAENTATGEHHAAPPAHPRQASSSRVALLTLCVAVAAAVIVTCRFAPRFALCQGL